MLKRTIKILAFLFITHSTVAQTTKDAGMWNTFSLEYKINSKFAATLDEEFRLKENFTRINLFYTNIGLSYKYSKNFKAAIIYRTVQKYLDDNTFSYRNRLMLDLTYKKSYNKFTASFRHRLQTEVKNYYTSRNGKMVEYYSRSKFEVKYEYKLFIPYVSYEIRYQLYDPRSHESDGLFHRSRYAIGTDYEINKRNIVGVYYLIQNEWNVSAPEELYIIGLQYSLTI